MRNFPQQTSNPFQTFPWMNLLFPQNPQSLYAGNPFLNMYVPAPNPSALTLASQMPPAGPGGGQSTPPGPPPTSATLTPVSAVPGALPGAQATPPLAGGMVPGIPGAGGAGLPTAPTGLPSAPPPPLPPAQYVAGLQPPQPQAPALTAQQTAVVNMIAAALGPNMGGGDRAPGPQNQSAGIVGGVSTAPGGGGLQAAPGGTSMTPGGNFGRGDFGLGGTGNIGNTGGDFGGNPNPRY